MSEADAPRTLRRGGEEHLRGRRMRVFLEEVVLHLPGIVNAQAVRQLDLIQRVLEEAELGAGLPGTRQLVLIEDPEFHGRSFTGPPDMGGTPKRLRNIARRCPASDQSRPPAGTDRCSTTSCWRRNAISASRAACDLNTPTSNPPSSFRRSIIPTMRVAHRGRCASPDAIFGSHRMVGLEAQYRFTGRGSAGLLRRSAEARA